MYTSFWDFTQAMESCWRAAACELQESFQFGGPQECDMDPLIYVLKILHISKSDTRELKFHPGPWKTSVMQFPSPLLITSLEYSGSLHLKVLCLYNLKHSLCVHVCKHVYTCQRSQTSQLFSLYT